MVKNIVLALIFILYLAENQIICENNIEKIILQQNNTSNMSNETSSFNAFSRSFFLNFFSELGDKSSICIIFLFKEVSPLVLFIVASSVETLFNLGNSVIGYEISSFISMTYIRLVSFAVFLFFGGSIFYQLFKKIEVKVEPVDSESKDRIQEDNSVTVEIEFKGKSEEEAEKVFENKNEMIKQDESMVGITDGNSLVVCSTDRGISEKEEKVEKNEKNEKNEKSGIRSILKVAFVILLSELGDRSQITTIILSASFNPVYIFIGSALAHIVVCFLCITLSYYLRKISVKTFFIFGAGIFVFFSVEMGYEIIFL